MNLFRRFKEFITRRKYPQNLLIKGRKKLPASSFKDQEKLYRSYDKDDLDENDKIKLETIKFPDLSCNWSRFSIPKDILFRRNAKKNDGCYSFMVLTSRYKKMATPVHEPINEKKFPNYAHVEVRALRANEDFHVEPQKKRKIHSKSNKFEYRQNLLNSLHIEFISN
ncbi:MAG: hypothetical protein V3R54_06215 [Thermodesulfovibrionia bacterium]